jgi:uncharacterized protein YndB with AHSA1/START domain
MGHVTYSQEINAKPEQVWAVLSNVARLPDWAYKEGRFPYPVEGKYGSDQTEGPGTIWVGVAADGQTATQKITAWEPAKSLSYELQETENAPLQMAQSNTFNLEPAGGATKVTWAVDWELTGGFSLNKLLIRFTANGAFEEMMAGSLENLKQLVENEKAESDIPANAEDTGDSESSKSGNPSEGDET